MEDVLEVYHRPHDPDRPVVCLDETSKQLIAETRVPIPAKPGHPARHDYEYERNGTANLFMMFAPLEGWRHVEVTDRHTAVDYAQILKELSDTHFPNASRSCSVQDNLNTHKPASLYEAFPAAEARRLVERFEWHYTPKHGSWLDMAESELGVLSSQCLDRRIPDKQTLIDEVAAWEDDRNKNHTKADWQFTTADARIKLKRLYPRYERNSRRLVRRSTFCGEHWFASLRCDFGDELAGHGVPERVKIVYVLHETTRSACYIFAIVFGQAARWLNVGESPGNWMVVDDRQAVDNYAGLERIIARIRNLSPSVVRPVAAHIDHTSRRLVAAFGDQLHGPIHPCADRGASPE